MKHIVFVADYFIEEYAGGAERTTDAIASSCPSPGNVSYIKSGEVTSEHIKNQRDSHWVICNFSALSEESKLNICKKIEYSIIEYDYKFCRYRSLELHEREEGHPCNCTSQESNKIDLVFYGLAKNVWFMSIAQRDIFLSHVKTLKKENTSVLSSVFSPGDLNFINTIKGNKKGNNYLIVKSANSWLKNHDGCIEYAKKNKLDYEVVENIPYHELLIKLSVSKGLIFLPSGADTCPRLTIEAFMLGCDTILNNFVQHKDEDWFTTPQKCYKHMSSRTKEFWSNYE